MDENIILDFQHVTKFPGILALDDVSFQVHHGEIHGYAAKMAPANPP